MKTNHNIGEKKVFRDLLAQGGMIAILSMFGIAFILLLFLLTSILVKAFMLVLSQIIISISLRERISAFLIFIFFGVYTLLGLLLGGLIKRFVWPRFAFLRKMVSVAFPSRGSAES